MLMCGRVLNEWRICWSDFLNIQVMTPFSYQGFGFTAILMMVAILSAGQLLKYLRERFHQHRDGSVEE
jgi:hypothetical protein